MAELKDVRNDYHGVTTLTSDIDNTETNIALLAFKVAAGDSLTKFEMVDQIIDDYVDASGVDTGNSTDVTVTGGTAAGGGGDPSTKFLMHPSNNGSSTVFTSDDNTGHTCTGGSNVELSTSHVAVGTHSVVFSGTMPNTLTVPNHADFDLGSGDFTIEYWLRYHSMTPAGGSTNVMIARGTGTGANDFDWFCGNFTGNSLIFRTSDGSSTTNYASNTVGISSNTWYYWTVERYNDVIYFYQNGTGIGTASISGAIPNAGHTFTMGGDMDWDENLVGYLDEVRISSVARYEGTNFTAPATDFEAGSPATNMTLVSTATTAETTDPTTGDIVMLLDQAVGTTILNTDVKGYISRDSGTTWTEGNLTNEGTWGTNKKILVARDIDISSQPSGQSMKYKIETRNQSPNAAHSVTAAGGAVTSTTQQKYGTASMYTSGNSDYLTIPNSSEFNFGNGNFTIEAWIYHTGTSNYQSIATCTNTAHSTYWQFRYFGGSGNFDFWVTGDTNGVTFNPGSQLTVNTWNHLAISRNGSSWYGFLNGTQVGATQTNTFTMTDVDNALEIGGPGWLGQPFIGYIDELRISNSARYTANFTPAVHTTDANTLLLLHMDGANSGTTFTDEEYEKHSIIHATSLAWK